MGVKTMINSRTKGKNGELELAAYLRERGFDARRGQQFKGTPDSPDIVSEALEGFHIECKRVEKGNLYDWLSQAIGDAGDRIPLVAHRRNRHDWVAVLRLEDLIDLIRLTEALARDTGMIHEDI